MQIDLHHLLHHDFLIHHQSSAMINILLQGWSKHLLLPFCQSVDTQSIAQTLPIQTNDTLSLLCKYTMSVDLVAWQLKPSKPAYILFIMQGIMNAWVKPGITLSLPSMGC